MNKITVFVGPMGSGKDYETIKILQTESKACKVAFADQLRRYTFKLIGKELNDDEYDFFKKSTFRNEMNIEITGREILQRLGTEIMRDYDSDIWCKIWEKTVDDKIKHGYNHVVVSDARNINEICYAKKIAKKYNAEFNVIFCNYKSLRYDDSSHHVSEKMALSFLKMGYKHLDNITSCFNFKEFDKTIISLSGLFC